MELGAGEQNMSEGAYWVNFHVGTFASVSTIFTVWRRRRRGVRLCQRRLSRNGVAAAATVPATMRGEAKCWGRE